MKHLPVLAALALAFSVAVPTAPAAAEPSPAVAKLGPSGGKASRQHAQAKAAKEAADATAEAEKISGCPKEKKGVEWNPRRTRHKQTLPALPAGAKE